MEITAPLKNIFCDGEYLLEPQRDLIEKAFNCRVHLIYGHTEGCVFGHSCDHSRLLHFPPQVGLLELLDAKGNQVTTDGQEGEMTVTGFNNLMFPIIRYRTGDIGVHCDQSCSCGRQYPLLHEVKGRIQDYVVDRNSNVVPLAPAIFNYNDFDWKGIRQFKVIQQEVGKLCLQIVRERDCATSIEQMKAEVQLAIQAIFGGIMILDVEFVDDIPRTNIGKFRYLEQKLNVRDFMYG